MNHDLFTDGENYRLKTIIKSVKRRAGFKKLLDRKLINTRKSYICTVCLEKYQQKTSIENENQNSSNEDADEFDENPICEDVLKVSQFINSVNWDSLSLSLSLSQNLKSHSAGLAGHLGKLVSSGLFEDGQKNIAQQYKNIELLKTVKYKDWIQERNVVVQLFLENCANIHNNRDVSEKKYNAVAHCIEQILYARKNNHITPFAFKRNLVTYSITISKENTTMNRKWEGCESSRTVSDVICEKSPPTPCPDSDIINMIDNNQKVGMHSGCIKEGLKVPLSICTTIATSYPNQQLRYNIIQICLQKTG